MRNTYTPDRLGALGFIVTLAITESEQQIQTLYKKKPGYPGCKFPTNSQNISCTNWKLQGAPTDDHRDVYYMHPHYVSPLLLSCARCIQQE